MGDSKTFTVVVELPKSNGKITAMRVQDLTSFQWFNWDAGVWDTAPVLPSGGGNIYIGGAAQNIGGNGSLTIRILRGSTVLASKTEVVSASGYIGVEVPSVANTSNTTYTVEVSP